jgi:hypothetical protein
MESNKKKIAENLEDLLIRETNQQRVKNILDSAYQEKNKNSKFTNTLISNKNGKNINKFKNQFSHTTKNFRFLSQNPFEENENENEIRNKNKNKSNKKIKDFIPLSTTNSKNLLFTKTMLLELKKKYNLPFLIKNDNCNFLLNLNNYYSNSNSNTNSNIKKNNNNYNENTYKIENIEIPINNTRFKILDKEKDIINSIIDKSSNNKNADPNSSNNINAKSSILFEKDNYLPDELYGQHLTIKSEEEIISNELFDQIITIKSEEEN